MTTIQRRGVIIVPARNPDENPRGGGGGRGGGGARGGGGPRGGGAPRGGGGPRGGGHRGPPGFRRHHHHRHGGGGFYPIYPWYPYYYYPAAYDVAYTGAVQPSWYQPESCPSPLSTDCRTLQPTAMWATSCFLPRFQYLRNVYGEDYESLASALAREEAPACPFPARTGAAVEYERRIRLAVAVLLNADGIPVPYPAGPPTPRPPQADSIQQPWMRALLTGWV